MCQGLVVAEEHLCIVGCCTGPLWRKWRLVDFARICSLHLLPESSSVIAIRMTCVQTEEEEIKHTRQVKISQPRWFFFSWMPPIWMSSRNSKWE